MSKPAPSTYRTANWRAYNAALKPRASLLLARGKSYRAGMS